MRGGGSTACGGAATPPPRRRRDSTATLATPPLLPRLYRRRAAAALIDSPPPQVQNKEKSYGKFEAGNKLSMNDFEAKLRAARDDVDEGWVDAVLTPKIEALMTACCDAAHATINAEHRAACFELLGFDFMLDDDLRVDLIEINSNPCLETWSCPLLEEIMPRLVDGVLRVGLDQILPPPKQGTRRQLEALEALEAAGHGFVKIFTPPARDGKENVVAVDAAKVASEAPAPAEVAEGPAPAPEGEVG